MTACPYPRLSLHAWLDGEAERHTAAVQAHLERCAACARYIENLQVVRRRLALAATRAAGDIEPLVALRRIREHMQHEATRSLKRRARRRLVDAWVYQRGALLASCVGVVLGVIALVSLWAKPRDGNLLPGVRVESLRAPPGQAARVSEQGDVTVIWVGRASP